MRLPPRHLLLALLLTALGASSLAGLPPGGAAADPGDRAERAAQQRKITYTEFDGDVALRRGTAEGVRVEKARVHLAEPRNRRSYAGKRYEQGTWESPWVSPGHSFTQLVPSWSALTPGDSWIEVRVRGKAAGGATTSWDVLGRWTSGDAFTRRTSVPGQGDDLADVNVDTWNAPGGLTSYQLRVSLLRKADSRVVPTLDTVGAMVSRLPAGASPTSTPGTARGKVLDVPRYSQMVHRGHYPQWGNGGEAWCSPTSTSMVLGYYDKLPKPSAYSWVPKGHVDPWVDFAARSTFDHSYDGAGNWPFNTAYAAPRAGKAFVTRLRSLREAERFIAAGIPLVASVAFGAGELDGTPISSSAGHLMVVVGFTKAGDVVVNDPAAADRSGVRRTYDRAQFEKVWLEASGGLVYVIRDAKHPLPAGSQSNW